MSFKNQTLHDGFEEILSFHGHRLQIRGFNIVENIEDIGESSSKDEHYISWDVKQLLIWEFKFSDAHRPTIIHQLKFSSQPNFICYVVQVPKLKIYFAAALDMSFKVYDRQLKLLESIHHEERAILQLEYDKTKDIILASGASGISVWKLYRADSIKPLHVLEKLYIFDGCTEWVTKMIYEPRFNRIYAIRDRSAQILSLSRRAVITELCNVHEAPLNVVCWYERNQFYLTGCSRGEIKCWTSNCSTGSNKLSMRETDIYDEDADPSYDFRSNASRVFALLHTFKGHTKAVTSIQLHPVSGLAISAGLDGLLKILNLEAMNELYSVQTDSPILDLKVLSLSSTAAGFYGVMFAQGDGALKLWRITSCCTFFSVCSSRVTGLRGFENMQVLADQQHAEQRSARRIEKLTAAELFRRTVDSSRGPLFTMDDPRILIDADESSGDDEPELLNGSSSETTDEMIVAFSAQDIRCFGGSGSLLGRFEPEHVVDGVTCYAVSVYQQLLYILTESDRVRVHDLRQHTCPLLREHSIKGSSLESHGSMGTCCILIDCMPNIGARHSGGNRNRIRTDARGNKVVSNVAEEFLVLGLRNGAVLFMDTLVSCEVAANIHAFNGGINDLRYSLRLKLLYVLGTDNCESHSVVRIYQLPAMTVMCETGQLALVSCVEISPTLHMFAVGASNGLIKLFGATMATTTLLTAKQKLDTSIKMREIVRSGHLHDAHVPALCFADPMRIFASCSLDSSVKIWDYEKRLVRTIVLNHPSPSVVCNGDPGDILISQGSYLLSIPVRYWDEGDALFHLHRDQDPWEERGVAEEAQHSGAQSVAPSAGEIPSGESKGTPAKRGSVSGRRRSSSLGTEGSAASGNSDEEEEHDINNTSPGSPASRCKQSVSFVADRQSRPSGFQNTFRPSTSGMRPSFLTQTQSNKSSESSSSSRRRMTIDDIENALLPQLQLQHIRSVKSTNSSSIKNNGKSDVSDTAADSVKSMQLVNNDWTLNNKAPPSTTASSAAALKVRSGDKHGRDPSVIDVLHPRFLVHKKPTAKTFRFEDLNLRRLDTSRSASDRDSVAVVHPNQYLANSIANFNKTVAAGNKSRQQHRYSVSPIHLSAAELNGSTTNDHHTPRSEVTIGRRIAQIGLSPRAQLTLLNSGEKHLDNSEREHEEEVICATLGMRVSSHYRQHRQSVHIRDEQQFQEAVRKHADDAAAMEHAKLHPEQPPCQSNSHSHRSPRKNIAVTVRESNGTVAST